MSAFIEDTLSPLNLDEDLLEYVTSLIDEADVNDDDTKESVLEFLVGSTDDEEGSAAAVDALFTKLRSNDSSSSTNNNDSNEEKTTALLTNKVNMKEQDDELVKGLAIKTDITDFFSKQIQLTNEIPQSMKTQRKEAQKKMRLEELERQRLKVSRAIEVGSRRGLCVVEIRG